MQSLSIGNGKSAYPTHLFKHVRSEVRSILKEVGTEQANELYFINPEAMPKLNAQLSRLIRRELSFQRKEKPNMKGKEINLI